MKLTIGMATFDDYDGAYFSIQALRLYHPEVIKDIEIVVVDNQPQSKGSAFLKNLLENWAKNGTADTKYVPMAEPIGTTQSRNRIFLEATGDVVLCMDSHVMIVPDALRRLFDYYEQHPATGDLLSGPMLYDGLHTYSDHFADFWRAEMWGIWSMVWSCCPGTTFSVLQTNEGQCDFRWSHMGLQPFPSCPVCGKIMPVLPYAQHEHNLINAGYKQLAANPDSPPFEIPGMGLGLFTCRKEAWLGFNPYFRGFGGEEMYIHEKYRHAGHKALCLPFLRWLHRFGRPNGIPYIKILTRWNKVRNYVLGLQELGIPLDACYDHFIKSNMMPEWEWKSLIEDPITREKGPVPPPGFTPPPVNQPTGLTQPRASVRTVGDLMEWAKTQPRDLDQHLDTLAEYAGRCSHVTEVTHRRESTVGLLAAKDRLVSFQNERDLLIQTMLDLFPTKLDVIYYSLETIPKLTEETDLVFVDTDGTGNRLEKELELYMPMIRKYFIIHDTQLFAEKGQYEGTKGLLPVLRAYMLAHPEWSVVFHTTKQYGLTVLSKVSADKPTMPGVLTLAANFAKASADFVADGMKTVTKEQYDERLGICSICDQRNDNRCSVCGCNLSGKAAGRTFQCPLGKWPEVKNAIQ